MCPYNNKKATPQCSFTTLLLTSKDCSKSTARASTLLASCALKSLDSMLGLGIYDV